MYKLWVWIFLAFAAGILIAKHSNALLLLLLVIILTAGCRVQRELAKILVTACCAAVFAFFYYGLVVPPLPVSLPKQEHILINGTVAEFPQNSDGKTVLVLATDSRDPYMERIRLSVYSDESFAKGERIQVKAELEEAPGPRNPGAFDYKQYLAGEGIYYLARSDGKGEVQRLQEAGAWDRLVNAFRDRALTAIKDSLNKKEAGVLIGMLLNDVQLIDEEDYELFQKTGIIHLFSVSGLHLGFLILLAGWVSAILRLKPLSRFVGTGLLIVFYASVAGWPVAVARSVLMALLCLLAFYTGRGSHMLNSLCLSGCIILLVNPQALFNTSFQLTFLATWGIVVIFPAVRSRLPEKSWWSDLLFLPLCAEMPIIPVIAAYFNMISPWSLLTNILTAYTSGAAVTLGFVGIFTAVVSTAAASLFFHPAGLMVELIDQATEWAAQLPMACTAVKTPGVWFFALYYLALMAFVIALRRPAFAFNWLPAAAIVSLICFLIVQPGYGGDGLLKVVFVDVGQGDCIYIHTPGGKNLLIDGGGSEFYDVGRMTVCPFLRQEGVRKMDLVVNSHPDVDHIGGVDAVQNNFEVENLGIPALLQDKPEYTLLAGQEKMQGGQVLKLEQGQVLKVEDDLMVTVLSPPANSPLESYNDCSLVLELRYKDFSMLLPGDISADVMDELAQEGRLKPCTVLKVPHHGSRNSLSSDFYTAVSPRYAVIQAGVQNSFGHPSQPLLDLLKERGIKALRTDRQGAITFQTDGKTLTVNSLLMDIRYQ